MVKSLKCSFCSSQQTKSDEIPYCENCWAALEGGEVPPVDFREYFSHGLERKLREVDSILFTMPKNFFLWYLKGHLEHELGSTKKALNSIKTSISYKGDYGDSWIRLGLIFSDMHRDTEATDHFRKGLEFPLMDPSNLVDAGVSLQASDQPKLAAEILRRALDLVPDEDRALVALGKVFVQMGELEKAREVLERGIEIYPHNEEVLRGMAQIHLKMNDLDAAMDMYSHILDQHPRDFEALLAKGEIHLRKGELSRSIKAYQAVRELDIHISWGGILRFIVSSLRTMLERNENTLSYNEELKKEYENIVLFTRELDDKAISSPGPEFLSEIESLVKVLENLGLNLKDQMRQFGDLLGKYNVEDSFHKHLEMKVGDLRSYIEEGRFFDAKQVAMELSPFLTDLRSMNNRDESKVKEDLERKLEELSEIGMGNHDLEIRLGMVEDLEKEGNQEGATFMLKEIEVSLGEYWMDASKRYHEEKKSSMKDLLDQARDRFDTSGLNDLFRSFGKIYEKGPRAVTRAYEEFMERYREDSSSFYRKETERLLNEIDLKLKLFEKDGVKVKELRKDHREISASLNDTETPGEIFETASSLMEKIGNFEEQQQLYSIRRRLREIDTLLGEVDFLGMDTELARNVEPVRRVIERSLKQKNNRLSEILTDELYENVEKILGENYRKEINGLLMQTEGEVLRLKGLGVENRSWSDLIEKCRKILSGNGKMTEAIHHLSEIQTDVQKFIMETLPGEVDSRLRESGRILEEGKDYGFSMEGEKKELEKLDRSSMEISSIDLLEETFRFRNRVKNRLNELLSEGAREMENSIRSSIDNLTELDVDRQSVMDILSMVNRADVLLESGSEKEAWELMNGALKLLIDQRNKAFQRIRKQSLGDAGRLLEIAGTLEMDVSGLASDHAVLLMKEGDPREVMELAVSLHEQIMDTIMEGVKGRYKMLRESYRDMLKDNTGLLPEGMPADMRSHIRELGEAVKADSIEELPALFDRADELLVAAVEKARERSYLDRCSEILETGFALNDPRARELVKRAQELTENIRSGDREGIEDRLKDLQNEMISLKSVIEMQNIEKILTDVKELDSLAEEVFKNIDDDRYSERVESLTERVRELLDRTTRVYNENDHSVVKEMSLIISEIRGDIVELEQEWRARKRLDIMEEMGLAPGRITDDLLLEDISNLNIYFDEGDWNRFFRTWERVEGQIRKMEGNGSLPGGSVKKMENIPPSPGSDILLRKGSLRSREKSQGVRGPRRAGGGISKLARDMAAKKRLIEEVGQQVEGERKELSDIAKSIAGARIEKLKKSGPRSPKDANKKSQRAMIQGGGSIGEMMEDALEIDLSTGIKDIGLTAADIREKLSAFFRKFPMMSQLEEARSRFEKGDKLMDSGDMEGAIAEYRRALSIAVRIGKVHLDMGKALATVRVTIERLNRDDPRRASVSKLLRKAERIYRKGDLLGCAGVIKAIRGELTGGDQG